MPTTEIAYRNRIPAWAAPLRKHARYKGAKGGRSRGASHFFAGQVVDRMVRDPDCRICCIREYQRTLTYSAKALIEAKIREFGLGSLFRVLVDRIERVNGSGVCIFQGMQTHNAESIKSLEGFDVAWIEEASSISKRSLAFLTPTIRKAGSEIWASWNPDMPDDPIEELLVQNPPADAVVVHATYLENPFISAETIAEADRLQANDPDAYDWIWMGGYNLKSDARVLHGKWVVDEFEPEKHWDGPYHGCDFGFARDPMTLVRCWVANSMLYIERESYMVGLELDLVPNRWAQDVPGFERYIVRADPSAAQNIAYLKRHGVPRIVAAPSYPNSVEQGIRYLRQFDRIVIHERCSHAQDEARLYSHKVDPKSGDILPDVVDRHNHIWDSVRYALGPLIKPGRQVIIRSGR